MTTEDRELVSFGLACAALGAGFVWLLHGVLW